MNKEEIQTRLAEEKLAVESHQKRIEELEKKLKVEAKEWDFGKLKTGTGLRIRRRDGWSFADYGIDRLTGGPLADEDYKVYGNLKNIVENEGPIVIGLSVEDAEYILSNWRLVTQTGQRIGKRLTAALERFNG